MTAPIEVNELREQIRDNITCVDDGSGSFDEYTPDQAADKIMQLINAHTARKQLQEASRVLQYFKRPVMYDFETLYKEQLARIADLEQKLKQS